MDVFLANFGHLAVEFAGFGVCRNEATEGWRGLDSTWQNRVLCCPVVHCTVLRCGTPGQWLLTYLPPRTPTFARHPAIPNSNMLRCLRITVLC